MTISSEDEFANLLDNYSLALERSYEKLKTKGFSLNNLDYSKLVANRIRAYYQAQDKSKKYLNKHKAQSGSDFFVETTVFALKIFAEVEGLNLEIASERKLKITTGNKSKNSRKSITPDISLWRNNTCVCAIECKTQLGYQRYGWLKQFESREEDLKAIFPEAKTFLLVMTGCNWSGFDRSEPRAGFNSNDQRVGEKFFCLLGKDADGKDIWPTWMPEDLSERHFHHPFEELLARIQLL
jgi:hypothetical protein